MLGSQRIRSKEMNDDNEEMECTVCNGTRVGKPNIQNINDLGENEGLVYQPIECQHCGGTGIEP